MNPHAPKGTRSLVWRVCQFRHSDVATDCSVAHGTLARHQAVPNIAKLLWPQAGLAEWQLGCASAPAVTGLTNVWRGPKPSGPIPLAHLIGFTR